MQTFQAFDSFEISHLCLGDPTPEFDTPIENKRAINILTWFGLGVTYKECKSCTELTCTKCGLC